MQKNKRKWHESMLCITFKILLTFISDNDKQNIFTKNVTMISNPYNILKIHA